jgi:hypothetical protein
MRGRAKRPSATGEIWSCTKPRPASQPALALAPIDQRTRRPGHTPLPLKDDLDEKQGERGVPNTV